MSVAEPPAPPFVPKSPLPLPAVTPDELLNLPDAHRFELIDGRLVEQNVSVKSSWIAGEIAFRIRKFLEQSPLGYVFPEGTAYRCFPNESRRVRRADVSFIRLQRWQPNDFDEGFCPIAPDLAVEVVSPHDTHQEIQAKLQDYFSAGVPLIWLVEPGTCTVTVYRQGGDSISLLRVNDSLSGEEILPGFSCMIAELFPAPTPATTASPAPTA